MPPQGSIKPATLLLMGRGYQLTHDWFTHHTPAWEKHIAPHVKDKPARCLEIGSYEGLSALWTVENLLTHPDASLTCVDIWPNLGIRARFDHNVKHTGKGQKVTALHMSSHDALKSVTGLFDFIYVDGDHHAKSALSDLVLSWPLLRSGGVLAFDDYPWQFPDDHPDKEEGIPPKPGMDAFLAMWKGEYEVLHMAWQVFLRKL